jgi:hypothetical protein
LVTPNRSQQAQSARYAGLALQHQRANNPAAARLTGQAAKAGVPMAPSSQAITSFINQGVKNVFSPKSNNLATDKPTGKPAVYDLPDPGGFSWKDMNPDPYPAVLPSLSAGQLGALSQRRSLADQRLKQAQAEKERGTALLGESATRAREGATRDSRRSIEDFMREAAGKSLARSPMVAGRFQRRAGEDLRLAYGEIDTRLSTEIAALQDMVSQAELSRADELAAINQEEVNMRADLERLFPASEMYG